MGCHFSRVSGMNCLIFNYLQMSSSPGLMYIFSKRNCVCKVLTKFCWKGKPEYVQAGQDGPLCVPVQEDGKRNYYFFNVSVILHEKTS